MSDDLESEIFVKLSLKFRAIRVIDNRLIPTTWKIIADVIYDDYDEGENPPSDKQIQGVFDKIRYWFDNIVSGAVLFSRGNEWARNAFISESGDQSVENVLVILPDEPADEVLAQVFQAKMNALATNFMSFGAIDIQSNDTNGLSFMFVGLAEDNLPDIKEWVGPRSYFDQPWWNRNDGSTIDVVPNEDSNLSEKPDFAVSLDFLVDKAPPVNATPGQIIHREFKPRVIDGGQ